MASGGNDINRIDTSPPQEAYILYGAVVGGPDDKDRFYDIRSDWPETEVNKLFYEVYTISISVLLAEPIEPQSILICLGCAGLQRADAHPCRHARPE
jgi:endoglucanase